MKYRLATPADGLEMLRLIESHPANGKVRTLYSRRPDAYQSYQVECPEAKTILCIGEDGRLLAQATCLPHKLYINGEVQTVGYITGLHRAEGTLVNILKMLETGFAHLPVDQFFCSILDDNQQVFDMLSKRALIHPICDYSTYVFNPAAVRVAKVDKAARRDYSFRRASGDDVAELLSFYRETGAGYSYFPAFSSLDDFSGLELSDFFILENEEGIVGAAALWNQRAFKQYIILGYEGI